MVRHIHAIQRERCQATQEPLSKLPNASQPNLFPNPHPLPVRHIRLVRPKVRPVAAPSADLIDPPDHLGLLVEEDLDGRPGEADERGEAKDRIEGGGEVAFGVGVCCVGDRSGMLGHEREGMSSLTGGIP